MKKIILLYSVVIMTVSTGFGWINSALLHNKNQVSNILNNSHKKSHGRKNFETLFSISDLQKFYTEDKGVDKYELRKKWGIPYGVKIWISQSLIDKIDENSAGASTTIASVGAFAGLPGAAISALTLVFKAALWQIKRVSKGKGVTFKINWLSPLVEMVATLKAQ